MKTRELLAAGITALALSSCSTITHTTQTAAIDTQLYNLTVADMNVAAKKDSVTVDWKWNPLSTVSLAAQKESATHTLLGKNDADVLVEPEYIVKRRGLFRGGSVTVTGYPATYAGFRPMTQEDAEKIATVNGQCYTALVNPVISTTSGKVVKKRNASILPLKKSPSIRRNFINVFGGAAMDIEGSIEDGESPGYQFGAMYGHQGDRWGWYAKLAINQSNDDDVTPTFTFGALKNLGSGFSAFGGIGLGGYFFEEEIDSYYYYEYRDVTKFSIPIELGLTKRIKCVNIAFGITYATPLSGGSGNLNPFLGVGYAF